MKKTFIIKDASKRLAEQIHNTGMLERTAMSTVKEFDILALLIMNPKRVFTYELITDLVWNEDYTYYSRKAINNHVSNLRKKLKSDLMILITLKALPESDINLHYHDKAVRKKPLS